MVKVGKSAVAFHLIIVENTVVVTASAVQKECVVNKKLSAIIGMVS